MSLRSRVHWNLLRFLLIQISTLGVLVLLVQYDLAARTPWILHPTITRFLGWITALYGLFWIVWWFFWTAIEGGSETIDLYNVTWAPVTTDFVTTGPFEWCRYPLAFGYLEFVWGLGFLVQSSTAVLVVIPIAAVVTILYLWFVPERRKLRVYGDSYRRYRKSAALFLPRIPGSATILHILDRRKRR
jgi:protein-S-isoprenylcysteine O-methyltransferase Ste14